MRRMIAGLALAGLAGSLAAAEWGQAPNGEFWNGHSKRFIYAPAFGFGKVEGAAKYSVEVTDDYHRELRFETDVPTVSLEPVWAKLPVGYVTVSVRGVGADGRLLGEAGRRTFWKKAAFTGKYEPAKRTYALARNKVFDYVLGLPQMRYLLEHGRPDPSYPLNGYPSKMMSALIQSLVSHSKALDANGNNDGPRAVAMEIAQKAADFLIAEAVPADLPLAHFTRTYAKEGSEYGRFKGEQDTIMLIYPATAGGAFLALHKATGEAKYRAAAERIAETYVKLQGEDGTWFLKQNAVTGKEVVPNRLVPHDVMMFLEQTYAATGREEFRGAADRAFAYLEKGPMTDWNWEGQFEDVRPVRERWVNLTKHPACSMAMYLLKRFPDDVRRLAQAEALLKFSEDQFVDWEPPYDHGRHASGSGADDGSWTYFCLPYSSWMTPCALEQYNCYHPIDASAAKMINTYLALWRATGRPDYLAKARALGDTATRMQEDDGFICTWWMRNVDRNDNRYHTWLNCLLATARALDNLANAEKEEKRND